MFKVKYFFITFSVIYMAFTFICLLVELENIATTNMQINRTVSLASDMAIQQAVASDEMFNDLTANSTKNRNDISQITSISVAKTGDLAYKSYNIFALTYNENKPIDTDDVKTELFKSMFFSNNSLFFSDRNFLRELCKITTIINGQAVPVIAQMGLLSPEITPPIQPENLNVTNIDVPPLWYTDFLAYYNKYVSDGTMSKDDADYLGIYHIMKKYTYRDFESSRDITETYFLAPTNVGVTYIDPNILQNAFICNMDLLMRAGAKSVDPTDGSTTADLTEQEGIVTINGFEGAAMVDNKADANLQQQLKDFNVIHNKNMVFVKGMYNEVAGGYALDNNVYSKPQIDYFVLDLMDGRSNIAQRNLMCTALGLPQRVYNSTDNYTAWLYAQGLDTEGTTLTKNDDHKFVCIARVTTYADVAVSISTPIGRQLNAMYSRYINDGTDSADFSEFTDRASVSDVLNMHCFPYTVADKADYEAKCNAAQIAPRYSLVTGNPLYVYTTYFAIM